MSFNFVVNTVELLFPFGPCRCSGRVLKFPRFEKLVVNISNRAAKRAQPVSCKILRQRSAVTIALTSMTTVIGGYIPSDVAWMRFLTLRYPVPDVQITRCRLPCSIAVSYRFLWRPRTCAAWRCWNRECRAARALWFHPWFRSSPYSEFALWTQHQNFLPPIPGLIHRVTELDISIRL